MSTDYTIIEYQNRLYVSTHFQKDGITPGKGGRTGGARGALAPPPQFLTFARTHFAQIIGCFAASHISHIILEGHGNHHKNNINVFSTLCVLNMVL